MIIYNMSNIYCVKCRKSTETTNILNSTAKNGRNMIQGNCKICNTKKTQFTKGKQSGSGIGMRTWEMKPEDYKNRYAIDRTGDYLKRDMRHRSDAEKYLNSLNLRKKIKGGKGVYIPPSTSTTTSTTNEELQNMINNLDLSQFDTQIYNPPSTYLPPSYEPPAYEPSYNISNPRKDARDQRFLQRKYASQFKILKKRMNKGNFPKMDDTALWKYVTENVMP